MRTYWTLLHKHSVVSSCGVGTMRHIHVELAHKKAPLELPAQEGDLPPPTAPTRGLDPGVRPGALRNFGQEDLRLQKVYQLSIFSQLGAFSTSVDSHTDTQQRPVRLGVKRGLDEPQLTHKRPHLGDPSDLEELEGGVLCGPAPTPAAGTGAVTGPASLHSCVPTEHSEGGVLPRSPPLSPSHNPSRRPSQHNHDRPLPDVFAPLSPAPTYSQGSTGNESCSNGTPACQPGPHPYETTTYETPSPASPTSPPGPFSPPHHTELQEPGEANEWGVGLESSPPERSATQAASSASNGSASWDRTPSSNGHRLSAGGHWPAKKRLLPPSDTGESCSEDEGPSTSKRSRLSLLAAGLGPTSCRSTDSKAAPYWNHLLPSVWDRPKVSARTHTHTR